MVCFSRSDSHSEAFCQLLRFLAAQGGSVYLGKFRILVRKLQSSRLQHLGGLGKSPDYHLA